MHLAHCVILTRAMLGEAGGGWRGLLEEAGGGWRRRTWRMFDDMVAAVTTRRCVTQPAGRAPHEHHMRLM